MSDTSKKVEGQGHVAPADAALEDFFFPTHGRTIRAASKEEAEKKLVELIKQEKLNTKE